MSLSTKILLFMLGLAVVCMAGFIVYKEIDNSRRTSELQRAVVEQKQLLDNITRAQSEYASRKNIEEFAKQQNINLDVIKKDLESLNARIIAISSSSATSRSQNGNNIPSTGHSPNTNPNPIDPKIPDPYGYLKNTQHLKINETFWTINDKLVKVPFGEVGFSAWQLDPWSLKIPERKYTMTSVLGQDESGRHYSYSKLNIEVNGEIYDVQLQEVKFLEEYPSSKFHWLNPKLYMFANGGVGISKLPVQGEFTPGLSISLISYGRTKTSPDLTILPVGVGYGVINKSLEFTLSPIQYNIGKNLPLMNNTYVGPVVGLNIQGNVMVGVGLSVGL